jgi:hypothetical protein
MEYTYQLQRLLECAEQITLSSLLQLAQTSLLPSKKFRHCSIYIAIVSQFLLTSAACERSLSTVKQIKSYLRSTVCDSRLSSLASFSVESFVFSTNFDSSIDEFDAIHIIIIN